MVETGRAAAFVMDDILLYSLRRRPVGRTLRHHAPIYDKWFLKPISPKGLNLNVPMSDAFKKVIASPTDSGDPAVY